MRKIAFFIAMLLLPCVSFAGLLSSSSPTTPVSKEYKQQLMGSPVYIEIFKEEPDARSLRQNGRNLPASR